MLLCDGSMMLQYGLTPLLFGIGCVQCKMMSGTKARRVVHAGPEYAMHRCQLFHDKTHTASLLPQ